MLKDLTSLQALVVDDSALARRAIAKVLIKLGIADPHVATDGHEALACLADHTIDVILCDLKMPGMDGVEFLRHLEGIGYPGAIVLISGEDRRVLNVTESLAKAHNLRVLGSLEKPVEAATLADILLAEDLNGQKVTPAKRNAVDPEELKGGIADGELDVYYQPKVRVATGAITGAEVLARWQRKDGSITHPDEFIPVAEASGLIDDITRSVVSKAVADAGSWQSKGLDLKIAVNISMSNLKDFHLPEVLASQVQNAGIAMESIVLEITESQVMKDPLVALEILTRLRLKGMALSIDDFGTGYASMEHLKKIPFTEMKIDRAFVAGASKNPTSRAILESAVTLAKKMNMSIVAEGVETQADWDLVSDLEVDLVQGFFVAKPMPASEFQNWLESWMNNH